MIRQSEDPKADLRKKLSVTIIDNAYMIRVALESPDANQAATIVNAVVEAYMEQNTIFNRSVNKNLQETLKAQLATLEQALKGTMKELAELDRPRMRRFLADARRRCSQELGRRREVFTRHSVVSPRNNTPSCSMKCCDATSSKRTRSARLSALKAVQERHRDETDRQLDARVADEFQKDPKVAAVIDQIVAAQDQLDKVREQAQPQTKAAVTAAKKKLDELKEKYAELWEARYDQIRDRLLAEDHGVLSDSKVHELEVAVEQAKRKKLALVRYLQSDMAEVRETGRAESRLLNHVSTRS